MRRVLLILLLASLSVSSQKRKKKEKLEEYTASNGVTYRPGDEIKLAVGSGNNGSFVYVNDRVRSGNSFNSDSQLLGPNSSGKKLKLVAILDIQKKNKEGIYFFLNNSWKKPYDMDIENAIANCEIKPCTRQSGQVVVQEKEDDKYDKLAKLKKLLDEGVLSQEEFESEKKKLLGSE